MFISGLLALAVAHGQDKSKISTSERHSLRRCLVKLATDSIHGHNQTTGHRSNTTEQQHQWLEKVPAPLLHCTPWN